MKTVGSLTASVSRFGEAIKAKLSRKAVSGAPEDQLRAPLETLLLELAGVLGIAIKEVVIIGETSIVELKTRPDYVVTRCGALVGFLEVKAPGKGADPRKFQDRHDKLQWEKLKPLPNMIYTDGNTFSLWRSGVLEGEIVRLEGSVETAGAALSAPDSLLRLFNDFLSWDPIPPTSAMNLAIVSAGLCRFLRDEVTEQMALGSKALTELAADWRMLLFPNATDEEFADGYAQAVTFGLLMARAQDIPLANGLDQVSKALSRSNTLIGTALRLLTDDANNQEALKTSLVTLTRVLGVVEWSAISKNKPEAWLYFYEEFLSAYDNDLRKRTGSYYTPPQIVTEMVRLVDEVLRDPRRFGVPDGLASQEVTLTDPAVGTGTFLLGVLRRIAETTTNDQGKGGVPGVIRASLKRLIGFELQFGPYAVAQLRLLAEVTDLLKLGGKSKQGINLRLYVADTLGNPDEETEWIPNILKPQAASRREANAIKRTEPITVVIGNPPYKEKARNHGGWIENGVPNKAVAPLAAWIPPTDWGLGAHAKHLRNLYVYFWRWASWKVFGDGTNQGDRKGIVCFITVAGFLNGPGFEKMRADLRRDTDEIWVIDCSPEGHQPNVPTRVFQGVQQPVCIVLASRLANSKSAEPARVRFRSLPTGPREGKFEALAALTLDSEGWIECSSDWRAPFLPAATGSWSTFVELDAFFVYSGSGVMPGRTWVIAPDAESLRARWKVLIHETDPTKKEVLFHPHLRGDKPGDKHTNKVVKRGLHGHAHRSTPVAKDEGEVVAPVRYGFRSFDRQWIIPDPRLINQPNPTLWDMHSPKQLYITALNRSTPSSGPAISFTALVPDQDHYKGSFSGRVFPLWLDEQATQANVHAGVLAKLTEVYGEEVKAEDVMAYLAAVAAHPAYIARFAANIKTPGLRIPVAADAMLFREAVRLGREVVWLQTFGERFVAPKEGRPGGAPRVTHGSGPRIPERGAIPSDPGEMPETMTYDAGKARLMVGAGYVEQVSPEVWAYEVSGKQVLSHWFSYRCRDRSRPILGDRRPPSPLGEIQPEGWPAEYTTELLNLLHVLGRLVALEVKQADLLERIRTGPTIAADTIGAAIVATPAPGRPTAAAGRRLHTAQIKLIE